MFPTAVSNLKIVLIIAVIHRNTTCDQLGVVTRPQLAQLVEHCIGIAEVMGSNPIQA